MKKFQSVISTSLESWSENSSDVDSTLLIHCLPQFHVDGKNKDDGCKDDEEDGEAGEGDGVGQDGLVGGAEGGVQSGEEG